MWVAQCRQEGVPDDAVNTPIVVIARSESSSDVAISMSIKAIVKG